MCSSKRNLHSCKKIKFVQLKMFILWQQQHDLQVEMQSFTLCGSSRGSATVDNRRKPQIYREEREGTVLTAIKT